MNSKLSCVGGLVCGLFAGFYIGITLVLHLIAVQCDIHPSIVAKVATGEAPLWVLWANEVPDHE